MESWYHKNLKGEERITVSDSGYTNSELALEYLKHFIKHTHSNETTPPKLLLMDSHISTQLLNLRCLRTQIIYTLINFRLILHIYSSL